MLSPEIASKSYKIVLGLVISHLFALQKMRVPLANCREEMVLKIPLRLRLERDPEATTLESTY